MTACASWEQQYEVWMEREWPSAAASLREERRR